MSLARRLVMGKESKITMKKIKIIAREMIINPTTGRVHSDDGLRVLNGYFEDIKEVAENYDKLSLILQYEEQYPGIKGRNFQITEVC